MPIRKSISSASATSPPPIPARRNGKAPHRRPPGKGNSHTELTRAEAAKTLLDAAQPPGAHEDTSHHVRALGAEQLLRARHAHQATNEANIARLVRCSRPRYVADHSASMGGTCEEDHG